MSTIYIADVKTNSSATVQTLDNGNIRILVYVDGKERMFTILYADGTWQHI